MLLFMPPLALPTHPAARVFLRVPCGSQPKRVVHRRGAGTNQLVLHAVYTRRSSPTSPDAWLVPHAPCACRACGTTAATFRFFKPGHCCPVSTTRKLSVQAPPYVRVCLSVCLVHPDLLDGNAPEDTIDQPSVIIGRGKLGTALASMGMGEDIVLGRGDPVPETLPYSSGKGDDSGKSCPCTTCSSMPLK